MSKDGAAQLIPAADRGADKPPKERTLLRAAEPLAKSLARLAGGSAVPREAPGAPLDPQTPAGDAYAAAARSISTPRRARCGTVRPRCSSSTCPSRFCRAAAPAAADDGGLGRRRRPPLVGAARRAAAPWSRSKPAAAHWTPTDDDVGAQLRVRSAAAAARRVGRGGRPRASAARSSCRRPAGCRRGRRSPRGSPASRATARRGRGCTRALVHLLADAYRHHWTIRAAFTRSATPRSRRRPTVCRRCSTSCEVDADVVACRRSTRRPGDAPAACAGGLPATRARTRARWASSRKGCAVVVRRSRFDIVEARSVTLRLEPPPPPLAPLLAAHPQTAEAVASPPTVGQLLRSAEGGREVLVLNSHLYFANPAVHVRLMQTAALLDEAMRWRDELKQESGGGGGAAPALLVCGDFNSDRTDAVVHLLLRGVVEPTHPDWATGLFTWLKSSGCIPTARRAAADLAQRLALEGDGSTPPRRRHRPQRRRRRPTAPAAAARRARARGRRRRRSGARSAVAHAAQGVRLLRDVRPPADGAPPRTPPAARRRAPRRGARADGARLGGRVRRTPSPAHRQIAARCAGARRRGAAAARPAPPRLKLCSRGSSPTAAPRASTASRATSFASPRGRHAGRGRRRRAARRPRRSPRAAGGARERVRDHAAPTHVTTSYVNCLDWIFVDKAAFRVRAAATLPPLEAMQRHVALPSQEFPSDHVWLACDVEWK